MTEQNIQEAHGHLTLGDVMAAARIKELETLLVAAVQDIQNFSTGNHCRSCAHWENWRCSRPESKDCAGYSWWRWRGFAGKLGVQDQTADAIKRMVEMQECLRLIKEANLGPQELEQAIKLLRAEQSGMLLHAAFPIGTTIYMLYEGENEETRIIDGVEYTRKVSEWHIDQHEYGFIDVMCDTKHSERQQIHRLKYYLSLEDAQAECERLNRGCRKGGSGT